MGSERLDALRKTGEDAMAGTGSATSPIPFDMNGVVFRQMIEYPVADFPAEVGFYVSVFGFETIALSEDYALFTDAAHAFFLSFRREDRQRALNDLKVLFMTADLDASIRHLDAAPHAEGVSIGQGSPSQRVIYLRTPAGMPIEIWEDPEPARAS